VALVTLSAGERAKLRLTIMIFFGGAVFVLTVITRLCILVRGKYIWLRMGAMVNEADKIRRLRAEDKKLEKYGLLEPPARDSGYTHRERYWRTMHFKGVDRIPNHEFGYWSETLQRWHNEGLPKEVDCDWKADIFFGFDPTGSVPMDLGWRPAFEHIVLEETDRYKIIRGSDGVKCMVYKDGSSSIPHYIEFPLKGREDWPDIKRRLDPNDPARYNYDWEAIGESTHKADIPIGISIGSLFGWIRNWMGFETVSLTCYDDPDLIEEIMEHLTVLITTLLQHALKYAKVDYALGWEDMAFNHGPIISPAMFEKWMVPRYKRITDILHKHGIDVVIVDCDGNINSLVELWLAGGVNCMFPLEINSGSDPVALREKFGQEVLLAGGIDKIQLAKGKKEIEREIERVRKTVESGGYIPHVDHRCPADVSYDNYLYYLSVKKTAFGL